MKAEYLNPDQLPAVMNLLICSSLFFQRSPFAFLIICFRNCHETETITERYPEEDSHLCLLWNYTIRS